MDAVSERRRNTRPGYPARTMLRAFYLKCLLGERYVVGFIERLRMSPDLCNLCGFTGSIPSESTFSRFFKALSEYPVEAQELRACVVNRLRQRLPDFGRIVAIDATDIESHANPIVEVITDPDADWGRRTRKNKHRSKGDAGTEPFFGYKMVALSDAVYGVPLVYIVSPANQNESPKLRDVVELAQQTYEWFSPKYLVADKGYDSRGNHEFLYQRGITPIIHIRKPATEDRLHDGFYNTLGAPTCDGRTAMEYVRTDAKTGKHLYRCPVGGCDLKSRSSGAVRYCDIIEHWVDPKDNLRVISVVARVSRKWKALYRLRTVIERYFSSLKRSRLLNSSLYLSMCKIQAHAGLSVLTYLGTVLARLQANDRDNMLQMRIKV